MLHSRLVSRLRPPLLEGESILFDTWFIQSITDSRCSGSPTPSGSASTTPPASGSPSTSGSGTPTGSGAGASTPTSTGAAEALVARGEMGGVLAALVGVAAFFF